MDRNTGFWVGCNPFSLSLSARRAWIEIPISAHTGTSLSVALRKESVDRNCAQYGTPSASHRSSLSARRAWIEIAKYAPKRHILPVALRKESVDRNTFDKRLLIASCVVALRKESVDRNDLPG